MVSMGYPCGQETRHMVCRQRDHHVQAFPPQRADAPLAEGLGRGTLRWCGEDAQAQATERLVRLRGAHAVPIMPEETGGVIRWDGFAQLVQGPWSRGMGRRMARESAARGMGHHDTDVEHAPG